MKWIFTFLMLITLVNLQAYEENWIDMGKYQYLENESTVEKIEVSDSGDSVFVKTEYDIRIYDKTLTTVLKYIEAGDYFGRQNSLFLSPDLKSYVIIQDYEKDWGLNYYIFHYHLIQNDSLFNKDTVLHKNGNVIDYERENWRNFYPVYWYKTGKYETYSSYEKISVYHNVSSMKEYVRRYSFTRNNKARYSDINYEETSENTETERRNERYEFIDYNGKRYDFYKYKFYEKKDDMGKRIEYTNSESGFYIFNTKFIDSDNFIFNDNNQIFIFNLTEQKLIDSIPVNETVRGLGYHNDNVLFANREMLYYFDINERRTAYEWEIPFNNNSTIISTNDSTIFLGISSKIIKMKISEMDIIPVSFKDKKSISYKYSIRPNPASDFIEISINNPFEDSEIEIYDVLGNKVMAIVDVQHLEDVGHLERIDVSHLSRGVYFVKIGDRTEKFVKR